MRADGKARGLAVSAVVLIDHVAIKWLFKLHASVAFPRTITETGPAAAYETDMTGNSDFVEKANGFGAGFLPGLLGVNFTDGGDGWIEAELAVRKELLAPNGFLHGASVIALADTACGYGCVRALPTGANGFTTIELKSNFLGTAREGVIQCRAEAKHLGRTTQLWDATIRRRDDRKEIALFRCTQMVLWPKA